MRSVSEVTCIVDFIHLKLLLNTGYEAYRYEHYGSWYIQELVNIFQEHAHKEHVLDLLTKVMSQEKASNDKCQTSTERWVLADFKGPG